MRIEKWILAGLLLIVSFHISTLCYLFIHMQITIMVTLNLQLMFYHSTKNVMESIYEALCRERWILEKSVYKEVSQLPDSSSYLMDLG